MRELFPHDPQMNFVAPYSFNDESLIRGELTTGDKPFHSTAQAIVIEARAA